MAVLGEMAAGLAHEINNPLAIISGRISLIADQLQNNEPKEEIMLNLSNIDKTVERISKITKALRIFSRDGDQDPKFANSLNEVIHSTLSLCTERLCKTGISIEVEAKADIEAVINPSQISQVLLNLICNAADAVENSDEKWIRIELSSDPLNLAKIRVIDSGPGIKPQFIHKLMEPFFTTKETNKGTGLGLSIAKGIIDDHSGSLHLDVGEKHTTFAILLPKAA